MLLLKEVMDGQTAFNDESTETLFQWTTWAGCLQSGRSEAEVPEIIELIGKDTSASFNGCAGSYREEVATQSALNLPDSPGVKYTLIDEVCCSGILEYPGCDINRDLSRNHAEAVH
jgi:hypothetical protein